VPKNKKYIPRLWGSTAFPVKDSCDYMKKNLRFLFLVFKKTYMEPKSLAPKQGKFLQLHKQSPFVCLIVSRSKIS